MIYMLCCVLYSLFKWKRMRVWSSKYSTSSPKQTRFEIHFITFSFCNKIDTCSHTGFSMHGITFYENQNTHKAQETLGRKWSSSIHVPCKSDSVLHLLSNEWLLFFWNSKSNCDYIFVIFFVETADPLFHTYSVGIVSGRYFVHILSAYQKPDFILSNFTQILWNQMRLTAMFSH